MSTRRNWLAALVAIGLGISGSVSFAQEIRDGANFFSPETRAAVGKDLAELEARYQVGFTVETVAAPDAELARKLEGLAKDQKNAEFTKAARARAQQSKAHGVFVIVWKNPSHLNVEFSRKLVQRGFTQADQGAVRDALLAGFRDKQFDKGLQDAVLAVRTAAERHARGTASVPAPAIAPAAPLADPGHALPGADHGQAAGNGQPANNGFLGEFGGMGIVGIVIAIAVVFIVVRVIGAIIGGLMGGGGGYGQPGYGGMGGGGMFGSLLTGMFGAMAGHYIYDNFFGGHSHDSSAMAGDMGSGADAASGGNEWGDTGWGDSGGGDFGGGDFGGGDFGGGDFGGGDFGGGGDF